MSADWTQQQLMVFIKGFEEADKDKSSSLSLDEVSDVLRKNGYKGTNNDVKALFKQLDVNRDQKITRDEFTTALNNLPRISVREFILRKAFRTLDKDGSGKLSRAEIEEALKSTSQSSVGQSALKASDLHLSKDKLEQLLAQLEKDTNDGVLDYEEYLRVMGMHESARVMQYVFVKLDKDKSGFLTKDELMSAIHNENELKLRAAKISDLLLALHKDSDQKLNYNEFVEAWVKFK